MLLRLIVPEGQVAKFSAERIKIEKEVFAVISEGHSFRELVIEKVGKKEGLKLAWENWEEKQPQIIIRIGTKEDLVSVGETVTILHGIVGDFRRTVKMQVDKLFKS